MWFLVALLGFMLGYILGKGSSSLKRLRHIGSEELKMVFLIRTDLEMTKGKIAAQCCHAVLQNYQMAQQYPDVRGCKAHP
jgi:hypothetical protein